MGCLRLAVPAFLLSLNLACGPKPLKTEYKNGVLKKEYSDSVCYVYNSYYLKTEYWDEGKDGKFDPIHWVYPQGTVASVRLWDKSGTNHTKISRNSKRGRELESEAHSIKSKFEGKQ